MRKRGKLTASDRMLTCRELSDMLNVSVSSVKRWSNEGILKSYRVGKRGDLRFKPEDVSRFLKYCDRGFPKSALREDTGLMLTGN